MIEHLRQERRVVQQLYGGAAQLIETAGTRIGPGTVEITVEGRPVGQGSSFREALAGAVRVLPGSRTRTTASFPSGTFIRIAEK